MALIRFVFWTAIFLASALFFTVLFEHGPTKFGENTKKEIEALRAMAGKDMKKKKDETEKLTPNAH